MENYVEKYIEKHSALMTKWNKRHKQLGYKTFVTDGIICPQEWYKQEDKILFILKEAYSTNSSDDWSLVDCLNNPDGRDGRIWTAIAEWCHAVQNTDADFFPLFDGWLESPKGDMKKYREKRYELLKKCAVINIKKSNGVNGSDDADLLCYVNSDWDLIKEQIDIISPTVIVCGSTFHLLRDRKMVAKKDRKKIFGVDTSEVQDERGCYSIGNRAVIAYYHPANQYPSALNYYGIAGMYYNYLRRK